jgi:ABC-type Fe3+-hydroxamate transport system substrate-binding protein
MRGDAARLATLSVLAVAVAACTSDFSKEPEPNIVPTKYKQEIIDSMPRVLTDPTNVRDAYISEPALVSVNKDQRYAVCLRSNSRDVNGKYTGVTDHIAYFYAGHLNQLIDATKEQCDNVAYKPFPELEKLCLGTSCR